MVCNLVFVVMKIARHSKIIDLINQYDIETQEELAAKLQEAGFAVTQATVSRDIRELKLMKAAKPGGGSRYMVMEQRDNQNSEKYKRALIWINMNPDLYFDKKIRWAVLSDNFPSIELALRNGFIIDKKVKDESGRTWSHFVLY